MLHRKSGYLGIMKIVPGMKSAQARGELNILSVARESPFLIRLIDGFLSSQGPLSETAQDNIVSLCLYSCHVASSSHSLNILQKKIASVPEFIDAQLSNFIL